MINGWTAPYIRPRVSKTLATEKLQQASVRQRLTKNTELTKRILEEGQDFRIYHNRGKCDLYANNLPTDFDTFRAIECTRFAYLTLYKYVVEAITESTMFTLLSLNWYLLAFLDFAQRSPLNMKPLRCLDVGNAISWGDKEELFAWWSGGDAECEITYTISGRSNFSAQSNFVWPSMKRSDWAISGIWLFGVHIYC